MIMGYIVDKYRNFFLNRAVKKIKNAINNIDSDLMDNFLGLLLGILSLVLALDGKYRENIRGFNARYAFRSKDNRIAASAVFENNKMKVKKYEIPDTNVTVIFKDGKALWEFLMSKNPDVFAFLLDSKLSYEGNINYVMKFAYMAKHLQHRFGL
jgi:hypothetical protein